MRNQPKTQHERSAATAAKRQRLDEKELRHRVRPGIRKMLDDLLEWYGIEEIAEALQNMIINAHTAGPEGSAVMLATPRHEIRISSDVAQRFERESRKESLDEWRDRVNRLAEPLPHGQAECMQAQAELF